MDEQERALRKQSIDRLIEQFRELNQRMKSDLNKLVEIQAELRTLSDPDMPAVSAASGSATNDVDTEKNVPHGSGNIQA